LLAELFFTHHITLRSRQEHILNMSSKTLGEVSSQSPSEWEGLECPGGVLLPKKLLAPHTSLFYPSEWNVNLEGIEYHMAQLEKLAIPENVLKVTGGFVRSPLHVLALAAKTPCVNCFQSKSFVLRRRQ
jgi:hypothetical protein